MVPRNLERKVITNIKQFSYNFAVPESTLSASFHEKGHAMGTRGIEFVPSSVAQHARQ